MKKLFLALFVMFIGIGVTAQNKNDTLFRAVSDNDLSTAEALLKRGAEVNHTRMEANVKTNPLTTAVKKSNFQMAKLLVENKADVNWKDESGQTALMYAAAKGSKDIVVLLVENGADTKVRDQEGNDVLTAAGKSGNSDLAKYLEGKLKENK